MPSHSLTAPTLSDIEEIARSAYLTIPEDLRDHAKDVVIHVMDFPDEAVCREMRLRSPFDLLGLYQGIPVGDKESGGTPADIDRVFLYRRPILDFWCEGEDDLETVVRHVLIHEIGHHFGFSDADMEALEAAAAVER